VELDDNGGLTGFMDFDASGCTANGLIRHPHFFGADRPIKFNLHKTSNTPSEEPDEPWSTFTDEQYGRES
jgi:hypothetical protein